MTAFVDSSLSMTPIATSSQLRVHGHHDVGGQQPRPLPRGERTNPAGRIDARLGHQPGGCCRANARKRSYYTRNPMITP
jgi:hypothetical protein